MVIINVDIETKTAVFETWKLKNYNFPPCIGQSELNPRIIDRVN